MATRADFDEFVTAAMWAPSGDNTQPWRFVVDAARACIHVQVDNTRDPSPMNAGQRMARVACGAAVENILTAAQERGWTANVDLSAAPVLTVRLISQNASASLSSQPAWRARVTNRHCYDARPLPDGTIEDLRHVVPAMGGAAAHWIGDRERIRRLARLVGQADAVMFAPQDVRRAFRANVRFDAAPNAAVAEGMPVASLELSAAQRCGMRLMAHVPDLALKLSGAGLSFAAHARKLINSASGLCLVTASDSSPGSDFQVGRAMQRAWLRLCEMRLAVQPMMSLPVLANMLDHGAPELVKSVGRHRVAALLARLSELVPEMNGGRPAALLRFGYATAPSARTGRLERAALVREIAPASSRTSSLVEAAS